MPHPIVQRLFRYPPKRLGYRGSILLALGVAWVLQGLTVWLRPYRPPTQLHELLPESVRVGMWILTGLLGVYAAFRRRPGEDWFGFAALVLPLIVRAFSYLWGTVTWIVSVAFTAETIGAPLSFLSAILWIVLIVVVLTCAGWPEPPHVGDTESQGA